VRFRAHVNFSVGEIKRLIDGLPGRPPPERWRKLARAKLEQIDALIARAKRVRKMLGDTLLHECPCCGTGRCAAVTVPPRSRRGAN